MRFPSTRQSRIEPVTYVGRHANVMEWLEEHFRKNPGSGLVKATVAGIGGGTDKRGKRYVPLEHAEVALLLHRAGVPFRVFALDIRPEATGLARRHLKTGNIDIEEPLHGPEQASYPKRELWGRTLNYLGRILQSQSHERHTLRIPAEVRRNIRILGPGRAGDATTNALPKANRLLTVLNLDDYLHRDAHPRHAARFFHALAEGGLLVTNADREGPFVRTLSALFGNENPPKHFESMDGKDVLVFEKKPTGGTTR